MKVFIVDDESIANARLKQLLKSFPEIEVVGESRTVTDSINRIIKLRPDLVFIDMEIDGEIGFKIIDEVAQAKIRPKYIVVSGFSHYSITAIRYKVDDYLLKPINIAELKSALERVNGNSTLDYIPIESTANVPLSGREKSVLIHMLGGKTSKEIADEMNLSRHTVDTYRRNILKKLGIRNTVELIRKSSLYGSH